MGNNKSKQVVMAGYSEGITDSSITDAALNNVRLKMQDWNPCIFENKN